MKRAMFYSLKKAIPVSFLGLGVCIINAILGSFDVAKYPLILYMLVWMFFAYQVAFLNYFSLKATEIKFPQIFDHLIICLAMTGAIGFIVSFIWIQTDFLAPAPVIPFSFCGAIISAMIAYLLLLAERKDIRIHLEKTKRDFAIVEERNRIARELHDSVSQDLFGMNLSFSTLKVIMDKDPQKAKILLDNLTEMINEMQSEMRLMIYELRPANFSDKSLFEVLENLFMVYRKRYGMNIVQHLHGEENIMSEEIMLAVYRLTQESLNNTLKHAKAKSINIVFVVEEKRIQMDITDDGIGFEPSSIDFKKCFGITGMRERVNNLGGSMMLTSTPGIGTAIKIKIKL